MKKLHFVRILVLIIFFGCGGKNPSAYFEIDSEIKKLKTKEDKKIFLETIFKLDQQVRGDEDAEIMLKYGRDSDEMRNYFRKQNVQDSINLIKIERYIAEYGHPKRTELGELAAVTPWAVIHHSETYNSREKNFETLYGAYLEGDIDDGAFSRFLGRMYTMKYNSRYRMESPYTPEDEINKLMELLNLSAQN